MSQQQNSLKERSSTDHCEPPRYEVVIYNDDFTPMDLVVRILREVFFKSQAEAISLMLKVHHSEKASVGTYSYDIAASKVRKATEMARNYGSPLHLEVIPTES